MPIFIEVVPKKTSGPSTKKKLKKKEKVTESKRVYGKGRGGTKETQIKKKPEMSKELRDYLKKLLPGKPFKKPKIKDFEKWKKQIRFLKKSQDAATEKEKSRKEAERLRLLAKGGKAKKMKAYSKGGKAK